jgi:hypothetical protein
MHPRGRRDRSFFNRAFRLHEVTKCATKKSVFFSKIKKIGIFACFFRANLTVLGVLVGSAGE